jgi:hypothetical protein
LSFTVESIVRVNISRALLSIPTFPPTTQVHIPCNRPLALSLTSFSFHPQLFKVYIDQCGFARYNALEWESSRLAQAAQAARKAGDEEKVSELAGAITQAKNKMAMLVSRRRASVFSSLALPVAPAQSMRQVTMLQNEQLSQADYAVGLKRSILEERALALVLKSKGRDADALVCIKRAKVIEAGSWVIAWAEFAPYTAAQIR